MSDLIEVAIALRPLLREHAAAMENSRRLSDEVFNALYEMGGFNLQLSADYDGPATDPISYLRVLEELCRGDASSGWCAMVGTESNACVNAFLAPDIVRKMLAEKSQATVALTVVGSGRAARVDGAYRVSGRWRFASGCRHSTWLAALCVVHDGDVPCTRENGAPLTRMVFARADDAVMYDTWNASGLRGTASDDFELVDVTIPHSHTFDLLEPPLDPAPVWRIPVTLRLAMSKAAAVCGMARAAMDALAEAALEGGRAYLYQNVDRAWQAVQNNQTLDVNAIANVRLAVVWSAQRALESLHLMQEIAGTAAVLDPAFDRASRDLEVARHHMQLQTHVVEDVGRVLLGMDPRNPLF
jgi:alkylation response protein AidB-like acyl-CoA dehydrogenase